MSESTSTSTSTAIELPPSPSSSSSAEIIDATTITRGRPLTRTDSHTHPRRRKSRSSSRSLSGSRSLSPSTYIAPEPYRLRDHINRLKHQNFKLSADIAFYKHAHDRAEESANDLQRQNDNLHNTIARQTETLNVQAGKLQKQAEKLKEQAEMLENLEDAEVCYREEKDNEVRAATAKLYAAQDESWEMQWEVSGLKSKLKWADCKIAELERELRGRRESESQPGGYSAAGGYQSNGVVRWEYAEEYHDPFVSAMFRIPNQVASEQVEDPIEEQPASDQAEGSGTMQLLAQPEPWAQCEWAPAEE